MTRNWLVSSQASAQYYNQYVYLFACPNQLFIGFCGEMFLLVLIKLADRFKNACVHQFYYAKIESRLICLLTVYQSICFIIAQMNVYNIVINNGLTNHDTFNMIQ